MATADLSKATRELFVRSLVDEVFMATPVIEEIRRRNKVMVQGGTSIKRLVDTAEIDDLMQTYTANEALTDQKKTTLDKPSFTMRYAQLPLKYDVDERLQNISASSKDIKLLDLAKHLTQKGQRGAKLWLEQQIFNSGTTTGVADSSKNFQSLISALGSDVTYGTLSRSWSAGTRDWWQGADPGGLNTAVTATSQTNSYSMTISNLRKWINETSIAHNMTSPADLQILMSPTNFNKLRAEMESKYLYRPPDKSGKETQKLLKMELDRHTIVSVPYLQTSTTMQTWVFILNMNDWELRIHSERNFDLTPFVWQGDKTNGYDFWLARIMICGNFICWKPNGSMWLSSVS